MRYPKPDYTFDTFKAVNFDRLVSDGIRFAILDIDGTLLGQFNWLLTPKGREALHGLHIALEKAREAGIDGFVILTNLGFPLPWLLIRMAILRWHIPIKTIALWAHELKPAEQGFYRALERLGKEASPKNTVMIGDRLDTDVLGAHRIGMRAVWLSGAIGHESWRVRWLKRRASGK